MLEKIKEQILIIRESGVTNMFDINRVQYEANQLEFYELVIFLEGEKEKYIQFQMIIYHSMQKWKMEQLYLENLKSHLLKRELRKFF